MCRISPSASELAYRAKRLKAEKGFDTADLQDEDPLDRGGVIGLGFLAPLPGDDLPIRHTAAENIQRAGDG